MKLTNYICALALAAVVCGCSLKEEPYGFISTDSFYKTAGDAHSSLIYAYSVLPEIEYYSRNFIALTEIPTENLSIKPDGGASNWELDELRPLANNAEATTAFRYGFIGINRANAIIAYVPEISMNEAQRDQIVGEAYFLRALHYFNLVRLFGSVPLRTAPIQSQEEAFATRASMEDIYAQIIADLEQAVALTDLTPRHGRANRAAAWSLLSKVHITLASGKSTGSPGYEFVQDEGQHYQQAAEQAHKVLTEQSNYRLEPNLGLVFETSVAGENGPEHIFSVSTDITGEQEGNFSKLPLMFIPYIDGARFLLSDDRESATRVHSGWNHFITEPGLYNSFESGDQRKDELIIANVWIEKSENEPLEQRTLSIDGWSRPFSVKFMDPNRIGDKTGTNTPVIRFADVLLLYAEAVGPTEEGYAAINAVRQRAGLGMLQDKFIANGTSLTDISAFRDAVIQERAWELAFEGHRLFDLRRTNKMEEMAARTGKTIQSGAYFFAIPQTEIDVNNQL